MASATTFLNFDNSPNSLDKHQLMSRLALAAAANTPATAAQLSQHWSQVTTWAQPFQVFSTKILSGLRIEFWGAGADTNALVAQLYGWNEDGPGHWIGTVTAAMSAFVSAKRSGTTPIGWHTSPTLHTSLYGHFDLDTDLRGCDTYTLTNDFEGALNAFALNADYPAFFELSLANSQYSWVGLMFSTISSTSAMAICRAIGQKSKQSSPDGY